MAGGSEHGGHLDDALISHSDTGTERRDHTGRRLLGRFAGMYFGGFRPAEAVGLSLPDLNRPTSGWERPR